jgi:hypothetical protein
MKTKFFALAFLLAAMPALAQNPVSTFFTSDTAGTVGMLIKYIGTGSAATVEIDAGTGDIELEVADVADNLNVDTSSVCAGGTAGSLDVSDAQCDTFGEVVDLINASTHWRAVLVSALRSDSTNNTMTVLAESQATRTDGLTLFIDSAVSDWAGNALVPTGCLTNIRCYMTPQGKLLENPFGGKKVSLRFFQGLSTFDTSSLFKVYSVKVSNKAAGAETVTTLFSASTGASTVNAVAQALVNAAIPGRPHEKMIVRIESTAATSAFSIQALGEESGVN